MMMLTNMFMSEEKLLGFSHKYLTYWKLLTCPFKLILFVFTSLFYGA